MNLNKAILGGRLTADPELRQTQSGVSVCSFSIAINRPKRQGAETAEVDFIRCSAFRQTAELIARGFSVKRLSCPMTTALCGSQRIICAPMSMSLSTKNRRLSNIFWCMSTLPLA